MKSFRIKLKTIHLSFSNIKKMVGTTTLLSVLFMSPGVIADTHKTIISKTATGIITKVEATMHVPRVIHYNPLGSRVSDPGSDPNSFRAPLDDKERRLKDLPPQIKSILPNNAENCAPITFIPNDLDGDDVKESYRMVSLLNCNGRNYVTPVRDQQGDTCTAYSSSSVIESHLGLLLDSHRHLSSDHNATDFLSINLSEGYAGSLSRAVNGVGGASGCCLTNMYDSFGSTLEAYYPDSEFLALWDLNDMALKQKKLDAFSTHYSSISECQNLNYIDKNQFYSQMKGCLLAAAQENSMLFVNIEGNATVPGNTFEEVDQNIKTFIRKGHVVQASIYWAGSAFKSSRYTFQKDNYFLRVLRPIDGDQKINTNHSVAIIGYIEGTSGNMDDYWIIKNSHGVLDGTKNRFYLVQTPSSAGEINAPDSTKRIFNTNGFTIITGLRFHKFKSNLTDPANINYTDTVQLNDWDEDGVIDFFDNCPLEPNPNQKDSDGDYVGDACDHCKESFHLVPPQDANPLIPGNDTDGDMVPDYCDPDDDNDTIIDKDDNCPTTPNTNQHDIDHDYVGNACDNCPIYVNPKQIDTDNDNKGDVCDNDDDGDGLLDSDDNCPLKNNPNQKDSDNDGTGDMCDNCPETDNPDGQDAYIRLRSCNRRVVRVPKDCQAPIKRLYSAICDFIKGVEISEHRLRELDLQRIKDFNPALPPTGGSQPWKDSLNINTMKNEQVVFKGVNETVLKQGMKELRIQPIYLEQLKVKASGVTRK